MTRQGQLIASSTFQNMTVYIGRCSTSPVSLPLVYGLRRIGTTPGPEEKSMIEIRQLQKHYGITTANERRPRRGQRRGVPDRSVGLG